MNQQEWHNWRSEGIGSSDAAVILKQSPYQTPLQLWEQKINKTISKGNYATNHGKEMEPIALKWFENETGLILFDNVCRENKEKPWMRATIDGLDIDNKKALEIKCPLSKAKHEEFKITKRLAEPHYIQVQHTMKVIELPSMYFMSFYKENGKEEGIIVEVQRDDKFIKKMVKEEEEFWDCVLTKTPPALTEFDYQEMNDDWIALARSRIGIREHIKLLEQKDEELKNSMISLCEGKSSKGGDFRFSKVSVKGNVDYKAIPELIGVDLDKYRKSGYEKWQLSCI